MFMRDLAAFEATPLSKANVPERPIPPTPSDVISAVFAVLDRAHIPYCLVHGYEGLPDQRGSDIDCIIDSKISTQELVGLFRAREQEIGAELAGSNGYYFTFRCRTPDGLPSFLIFDFSTNYYVGNMLLCSGAGILASRRAHRNFWIASPAIEFKCLLARLILKDRLNRDTARKLSDLYDRAPAAVLEALSVHWPAIRIAAIAQAAKSGNWDELIAGAADLKQLLKKRLVWSNPVHFIAGIIKAQAARFNRFIRPAGIHVVLLGPDGAGKSSTIAALEQAMTPLFSSSEVRGFAPSLRQLLKKPPSSTSTPHALKPRSLPTSVVRAAYWLLYGTLGYAGIYWAKVRSRLILNDRHYVDILVDPVRYRYGGPKWLLKLIWAAMPKPDVVILLHGPAEVLQARKRELTVEETARQCRDYLALVTPMKHSHIVDATQPFGEVVSRVSDIVLSRLSRQSGVGSG